MLSGDTFTQLSERWHSTSWLDHCLSTSDGHNLITAVHVQYGTSCRDHIPVIVDISIESVPVLEDTVITDTTSRVDWDKLSVADKAARARNSADPLARDKWIWRRTTNIASFCCPPDNLGLAESRQPADSVIHAGLSIHDTNHAQLEQNWIPLVFPY